MPALATMLHCNSAMSAALLAGAVFSLTQYFRKFRRTVGCDGIGRSLLVATIGVSASVCAASEHAFAQKTPNQPVSAQVPPLTVDRDPVRSPDAPGPTPGGNEVRKEGGGYVLRQDV